MTRTGSDIWRKAGAVVALVTALLFVFQAGPGHADLFDVAGGAAAVSDHHPGDGDLGHEGHVGGAHCSGHCGGHTATAAAAAPAVSAPVRQPVAYQRSAEPPILTRDDEPLTKPPAA